eukprot:TRINITY_DN26220_c0_g1_i1.p1 TRINITY_DN26220_c0_g1~~TRINITY_DN26220_c0_g1_i1.p1  ORF type:complete len:182 (+),score=25.44 TRINITY_DN26220_c0_g1_i1:1-546(+)
MERKRTHSTSSISPEYMKKSKTIQGMAHTIHKCLALQHSEPLYHPIYDERIHPFASHKALPQAPPSVAQILDFIMTVEDYFGFPSEVYTTTAIYMDRLAVTSRVFLDRHNWRRILLVSLVVSAKYTVDGAVYNSDFVHLFPYAHDMHRLERVFLGHIQYALFIECSHYSAYYFALNSMAHA